MKNIYALSGSFHASNALMTHVRKLPIFDARMPGSVSKIPVLAKSLMTGLFCLCAGNATGFSTKSGKMLFGKVMTRYCSH